MRYRLKILASAQRVLKTFRGRLGDEIAEVMLDLREDPHPPYSKGLQPGRELHKIRVIYVDGWRVVYQVEEADRTVIVLAIKRRNPDTYLNL